MSTKRAYWACQILGWGSYVAIGLNMTAQQIGWRPSLIAGYLLFGVYSIALTDWLRREMKRRHWLEAPAGKMFVRLAGAVLILGSVQTLLVAAVSFLPTGGSTSSFRGDFLAWSWVSITTATATWCIFYIAFTAPRRYREKAVSLQLALREAELRALEAQVNPHFLFNCLNSIRALVLENPPVAQDMLTRLANILRFTLHRDLMHTIPLATEVEAVTDYLALEKIRYEDRLRVEFAIHPNAAEAAVPPMLLQTLVENALKHGIAPLPNGGEIFIRATPLADSIRVEVENTGQLCPSKPGDTQVGLANTRERLRLLYGDRARLDLRNQDSSRVLATAIIPRSA